MKRLSIIALAAVIVPTLALTACDDRQRDAHGNPMCPPGMEVTAVETTVVWEDSHTRTREHPAAYQTCKEIK